MRNSRLVVSATAVATLAVLVAYGCEKLIPPTESGKLPARAGPAAPVAAVLPASTAGQWSAPFAWPLVAIHAHLLPDGRVLTWSGYESMQVIDSIRNQNTSLWDPTTGVFTQVQNLTTDIFCSGHAFLGDGTLLVAGGHIANNVGLSHTNTFNYAAPAWVRQANMAAGRWYPTVTTLADGRALTVSGNTEQGTRNLIPEVWNGTSWTQLTTASLYMPYYPWMFVAPDGRVFAAGSDPTTRMLNTSGTGQWTTVAHSLFGWRDYGTAVMYWPGKVLIAGGSTLNTLVPTNTAEVIDLGAATPAWRYTAPMAYARRHPNATILPDGTVLVTGGTSATGFNNQAGAVFAAELWNPSTGTWTTMASMHVQRLYHAVALLLPDGRVLSAGGGRCPVCTGYPDEYNAELYSPPYLFKGARPTIAAAPSVITYGQTISVQTPDAPSVAKVTLVRLSSVTHAFNENQRFNSLLITARTAATVSAIAPTGPNRAPPGHYMLFILNANGVPSVATIVRLM